MCFCFCLMIGAYPVSKLKPIDNRLPIDVSVYAYSSYRFNRMNESALPAVAFTAVLENPLEKDVKASVMLNIPAGVVENMRHYVAPMGPPIPPSEEKEGARGYFVYGEKNVKRSSSNDDTRSV